MSSKRKYLIFEDTIRDKSLKLVFDSCVNMVLDDTARISKTRANPGYPQWPCFRVDGNEVLLGCVLRYYLSELNAAGFDYEKAKDFSERMRKLWAFRFGVDTVLRDWVNQYLRNPYYYDKDYEKNKEQKYPKEVWVLEPRNSPYNIPEDYFKFACYIAVSHLKFGMNFDSLTANRTFQYVTELGSDLPAQLKKHGSGDIPKEILEYKDDTLSCKANDAFATIKITMKEEREASYAKVLDFLIRLLETDFPCSYSIDFRSPEKNYLPIKKLPKKGVNHLFANAVQYSNLHSSIERYARLAMTEDEWYTNIENEQCAMPGTFAVFSIGLLDEAYHSLVADYLRICDGEHQGLHGQFVLAYIEKFGFTEKGLELYTLCDENIQHLPTKLETLYKKMK